MISKKEVEHIAKLSRLELTEKEIEKMQKDMSAVLDYFNLLKKVPKLEKKNLESDFKNKTSIGETREDKAVSSFNTRDELIAKFPSKKGDYAKVKTILN